MNKEPGHKHLNFLGAIGDLVILLLLIGGAGFAGYYIGINQRLAPAQLVMPGTPGAIPLSQVLQPQASTVALEASQAAGSITATQPSSSPASLAARSTAPAVAVKNKYWLTSAGVDYVGYAITAKVNDQAVDNFFGPGKTIDITRHVKTGKNTLVFECKAMDEYNSHKGDAAAVLTVKLVSGPSIREDYAPSSVLLSLERNASETQNYTQNLSFTAEE